MEPGVRIQNSVESQSNAFAGLNEFAKGERLNDLNDLNNGQLTN